MPINSFIYPVPSPPPAYSVANSCRFNDGDSAYMHKTPGSAGNQKTWTYSGWIKRGVGFGVEQNLLQLWDGTNGYARIHITTDNQLQIDGNDNATNNAYNLETNRVLRDPSAWMHVCIAMDTTQGTEANRLKMYINGTQESSFATETYPAENVDYMFNIDQQHNVGRHSISGLYFDGYMAEVCMIDGLALTPTSFGEFDEDSPQIFKPIDVSGLTFGTNGFYLDFEDSSNLGNDANGGTDLTEVNLAAADQATDTPTNNFATLNPLDAGSEATLSEGNCKYTGGTTVGEDQRQVCGGTFGVSKGKWYYEVKKIAAGDYNDATIGIYAAEHVGANIGYTSVWGSAWNNLMLGCFTQSGNAHSGTASTSYGDSLADDEILGVALDLDNGAIYFSEEGTFYDSGDPTSGASKTGAASNFSTSVDTWIIPFIADGSSGVAPVFEFNFGGCPAFTVSSGNSDANGYGNFEFAPPSGYYAPCSKNLAEYG